MWRQSEGTMKPDAAIPRFPSSAITLSLAKSLSASSPSAQENRKLSITPMLMTSFTVMD